MRKGLSYILLFTYLLLNILNYVGFIRFDMINIDKIVDKYTPELFSSDVSKKQLVGDAAYLKALYDRVKEDKKEKEAPRNHTITIQINALEYIVSHNEWSFSLTKNKILFREYAFNLKTTIPEIDSPPPLNTSAASANGIAVCHHKVQVCLHCLQTGNSLVG